MKLVWLTRSTGVALADGVPFLLRTTDAGHSWVRKALPGDWGFFRLERFGNRLWVYGAHIARSDDLGETWRALPAPMGGTLAVSLGMSFVSPDHGWLSSLAGTLWETENGGETWTALGSREFHGEVLLVSSERGWVSTANRLVAGTNDGGKTWRSRRKPEDDELHPLRRDLPGLRLPAFFNHTATADTGTEQPLLDHRFFAVSAEMVGQSTPPWLSWYRSGELVKRGPPLEAQSSRRIALDGAADSIGLARLGWAGEALYRSEDAGRSWFWSGSLPERAEKIRGLRDGAFIARSRSGVIYRSEYLGGEWSPARGPLNARVLDPLVPTGESLKPSPDGGLECLAAEPSRVTVDFGQTGYGDSRPESERLQTLRLSQIEGKDFLEGRLYSDDDGNFRAVDRLPLTSEQARAVRQGLVAAVLEPMRSECRVDDAETVAIVRIQCHDSDSETAVTLLARGDQKICNGNRFLPPEAVGRPASTYQPAIGIGEFAEEALTAAAKAAHQP